jgi:hypothetical protein
MVNDPDYIAAVEQEVEKKYGKDAVINPKSLWNPSKEEDYQRQLKEYKSQKFRNSFSSGGSVEEGEGFFVYRKLINTVKSKKCLHPQCNRTTYNVKDEVHITKFDTCFTCYVHYVEGRLERWNSEREKLLKERVED